MQNNIKKTLVILPMIFLLCMSFIGIDAKADDKVDKQDTTITSSKQNAEDTQNKDAKSSSSATTSGQTTSEKSPFGTNTDQNKDSSTAKNEETTLKEILPEWKNIDGKLYYVTKDGIVKDTGWFKEKDKNPDAKNDYEYYLDENYAATIGWKKIDDAWYYFNEDGIKIIGWKLIDNVWYYFNEAGIKQTGWKLIDSYWYHLNEKGIMDTGWIQDQGNKYYLDAQGGRAAGKKYIEDKWYFFGDTGILQTGIHNSNGKYYYSNKDGVMGANEWINTTYKYYVKADSSLATGSAIIDNVMQEFDTQGRYLGSAQMEDHLFIKYLSVGDADCTFIKLPNEETALIDTGTEQSSEKVVTFLKGQDLKQEDGKGVIDYIVITHGHSDHIGGLASILDNFNVKKVYMPDIAEMKDWYSNIKVTNENRASVEMLKEEYRIYEDAVQAMENKDIKFTNTKKGKFIDDNKILRFVQSDKNFGKIGSEEITADYWGINENSAIVYLDYGDLQALFPADMEWNSEKDFWENDLLNGRSVDILKVPHHGNDTSSTGSFIRYLKPDIGIISRAKESIEKKEAYNSLTSNGVSLYETSEKDGISIYATPENWTVSK